MLSFKDIEMIPIFQKELEGIQADHRRSQQRLMETQEEAQREPMYQQTIKK